MQIKELTAINIIEMLTCHKNTEIVVEQIRKYYEAKYVYLLAVDDVGEMYKVASTEDDESLMKVIQGIRGSIQNNSTVCMLNNKTEIVGYLVIGGEAHEDAHWMLETLKPFLVSYLIDARELQILKDSAYLDKLTAVNNRNKYIIDMEYILANPPESLGVIFIDINSLKETNDKHGHEYGDSIIKETARRLNTIARKRVYRFGGDEFIIILQDINKDTFENYIQRIKQTFESIERYSISMGYSYKDSEIDVKEQIQEADSFMYKQKKAFYESSKGNRRKTRRNFAGLLVL